MIWVRKYKKDAEYEISKIITKDLYSENIKDYKKEDIDKLSKTLNPQFISKNGLSRKSAAYIRKYIKDARGVEGSRNKRNILKFDYS